MKKIVNFSNDNYWKQDVEQGGLICGKFPVSHYYRLKRHKGYGDSAFPWL